MYPSPISVSVPSYGCLVFLSWDNKLGSSTLYHARLHSPVEKMTVIAKKLPSNQVHCKGGVAFLSSCDGPVLLSELEDNKLKLVASKITTKERQRCLEERFHYHLTGTLVREVREKAKKRFNGALFSDQSQSSILEIDHDDETKLFAGSKVEGCQDGPAKQCQFKQPIGISVEFDTVVYACDAQSNSVKLITPLNETAKLLDVIGKLYDFSVHMKGQSCSNMTLSEASNNSATVQASSYRLRKSSSFYRTFIKYPKWTTGDGFCGYNQVSRYSSLGFAEVGFYNVISWNCRHESSQLHDVRCGTSTFNKPY
eukprot:gene15168-6361_t